MSTDPRAWRSSLANGFAARLALATAALIAAVCSVQSWILARSDLEHVRRHLTARGRTVAAYVAHEAEAAIPRGSVASLQELAEQVRAQSDVVYTRFFDRRGLLLAAVGTPPPGTTPLPATTGAVPTGPARVGPTLWEFQAPVHADRGRELVGTVAVSISIEPLVALRRHAFRTAALWTSLFALVGLAAAMALARAITRPLVGLTAAADRIARGDFDARVTVRTRDELGRLGRSFNAMVGSLAASRAALEEKVRELEIADHLKSEFLATVSHELRTPLNVIIGYAEMLADEAGGSLSPEQAGMVGAIRRYSLQQRDLITSVLDFSRLSSGRVSLQVERFALEPLLAEVEVLHREQLRDRLLRLDIVVDGHLPALETDRIKLQEIVRNLIDNAIKFTEHGVITVTARSDPEPGWLALTVADTGPGIPPEELESIFEAFRQIGESSTRGTGGVGLGLSIVHRLVAALGGSIVAESQLGAGSTFRVRVPVSVATAIAGAPESAEAALDAAARNTAAAADLSAPSRPPTAAGSSGRTDRAG